MLNPCSVASDNTKFIFNSIPTLHFRTSYLLILSYTFYPTHVCNVAFFKAPNSLLHSAHLNGTLSPKNSAHLSYPLNFPCLFKNEIRESCCLNQVVMESTHFVKHFPFICASLLIVSVLFSDCLSTGLPKYTVCTQWTLLVNINCSLNTHAVDYLVTSEHARERKGNCRDCLWWTNK